jgi:hypothetical protein
VWEQFFEQPAIQPQQWFWMNPVGFLQAIEPCDLQEMRLETLYAMILKEGYAQTPPPQQKHAHLH